MIDTEKTQNLILKSIEVQGLFSGHSIANAHGTALIILQNDGNTRLEK